MPQLSKPVCPSWVRALFRTAMAGATCYVVCLPPQPVRADSLSSQLDRLRQMGVAVALPATVPAGFRLTAVLTPKAWAGTGFGPAYVALYSGPGNQGFAIQSAALDLGNAAERDIHPATTLRPRFFPDSPPVGLYWLGARSNLPPSWASDWVEGPAQYYRLVGPAHISNEYGRVWSASRDIDQATAVKVLDSLHIVGTSTAARRRPEDKPRIFLTDFEQDNQWRDLRNGQSSGSLGRKGSGGTGFFVP